MRGRFVEKLERRTKRQLSGVLQWTLTEADWRRAARAVEDLARSFETRDSVLAETALSDLADLDGGRVSRAINLDSYATPTLSVPSTVSETIGRLIKTITGPDPLPTPVGGDDAAVGRG